MLSAGSKASAFTLRDLDGIQQSLDEILSRGPVLLVLYKISCPVCQFTLPFVNRLVGGQLQIVAISQDDAASTRRFEARFKVSLPTLIDPDATPRLASGAGGIVAPDDNRGVVLGPNRGHR